MTVARDHFDQLDRAWTDTDYDLLLILEEIASPDKNPGRTLAAYMADIYDLLDTGFIE